MSHDQSVCTLTNIAYGQAVMFSTNQAFLGAAAWTSPATEQSLTASDPARSGCGLASLIDVMTIAFTHVNIGFFWLPIVSTPTLTRD